jgi:hypothetical protein
VTLPPLPEGRGQRTQKGRSLHSGSAVSTARLDREQTLAVLTFETACTSTPSIAAIASASSSWVQISVSRLTSATCPASERRNYHVVVACSARLGVHNMGISTETNIIVRTAAWHLVLLHNFREGYSSWLPLVCDAAPR